VILLDTNAVSELMRPSPHQDFQAWLTASGDRVWNTTAVTIAEIEYGLQRLPSGRRRAELMRRFEILADLFSALPLDQEAGVQAGRFRALRESQGLSAHPSDMMIAGIAATNGAALATRNVRDFSELPIELINPWGRPAPP
jgi:hypothetical protein